jgi:acetolactate synthase-1/2/3 large subunit
MKASDLFIKALESEGVEYVFGIPGEENLDLLESLRTSSIKLILTRHEQAAGFMAATYGRLTGKAGVCLATLGPGATNFVTSAAYAQLGGMPMLMITGQKPVKVSKQGHFQIVDIVDMMKPLTKFTRQIVSADNIPARVRESFRRAEEERPGATHLELPEDIADDQTDAIVLQGQFSPAPHCRRQGRPRAVEAIRERQATHSDGRCGCQSQDQQQDAARVRRRSASPSSPPRWARACWMNRIRCGWAMPRCRMAISCIAPSKRRLHHQCRTRCDREAAVLHAPRLRTVIHVNYLTAEVDTVYFPQIEVVGDIANTIWRIKQSLEKQAHWDFSYDDNVRQHLNAHLAQGRGRCAFPDVPGAPGGGRAQGTCRMTASSASTTACTNSGSPAITAAPNRTPCCWTTPWPPWARACHRQSRPRSSTPIARWWRSLVMAVS